MKIYEVFEQRTIINTDGTKKTYSGTFRNTRADDINDAIHKLYLPLDGWTTSEEDYGLVLHTATDLGDGRIVEWFQNIYMVC